MLLVGSLAVVLFALFLVVVGVSLWDGLASVHLGQHRLQLVLSVCLGETVSSESGLPLGDWWTGCLCLWSGTE